MGTPNSTLNSKSYEDADLTKRASGFKDKMLFLVHGSADDNVHIQQTMLFVKAMADEGVPFRQLVSVAEKWNFKVRRSKFYGKRYRNESLYWF